MGIQSWRTFLEKSLRVALAQRKRRLRPPLVLLLLGVCASSVDGQTPPSALLPGANAIAGWTVKEGPKLYSGDQLFDYMDGAGEIPRSYGFQQLAAAKYVKGKTILEVAVFDMGSAANAFGYYSARSFLERTPKANERILPLDNPAHLYATVGVLTFWKDRYTVILQPDVGSLPDTASLTQFARAVSAKIRAKGRIPDLLERLPRAGMVANTARYVRGKAAFDATIAFQAKDVFGMTKGADAVAAEYALPGAVGTLAIVREATSRNATDAIAAYRQTLATRKAIFAPNSPPDAFAAQLPRGKAMGTIVQGRFVGIVVGAKDTTAVASGLKSLRAALKIAR